MKIFELETERERNLADWLGSVARTKDDGEIIDAAAKIAVRNLIDWIDCDEKGRELALRKRAATAARVFYRQLPKRWAVRIIANGLDNQ